MTNWAADYLTANPDLAALPRVRHRYGFTFDLGAVKEAHFAGKPAHYEASPGDWRAIDTALQQIIGGKYGAAHLPVRLSLDGLVETGGGYSQRTTRVAKYRPSNGSLSNIVSVPVGTVQGDSLIASGLLGGAAWEHKLTLTEDGVREVLSLASRPTLTSVQAQDYLVLETQIVGPTWLNGELQGEFSREGYIFPMPVAWDANGRRAPTKRYARTISGVQYLYTGIPASWLATAVYPVTIDPDFTGATVDGHVYGDVTNGAYSTARNTSTGLSTAGTTFTVGQLYDTDEIDEWYEVVRGFLKFDTSAIPDTDSVTQVNLKLVAIQDSSNTDFDIQIVKQDWSAQDPLAAGNREAAYDNCLSGTLDDNIWRNTLSMSVNTQYTSGNLATAWVSKTGATYYSLRSSRDANNNSPTSYENIYIAAANHATSGYRPVLTVVHSAGGTAVKDILGMGIIAFAR